MRILFSLTYYTPYISGLTIIVKRLAEELTRSEYPVTVLCFKHEEKLENCEIANGVLIRRVKPEIRVSKGFLAWKWIWEAFAEVRKSDVVIVNLPQFEGCVTAVWAKLLKKKLIAYYLSEVVINNTIVQKVVELSNKITMFIADKIVTYSEDYGENSRLLKNYSGKCVYIYPPIPQPKVNSITQEKLRKVIGKADLVIGVAARVAREKGFEYLFNAIPEIEKEIKTMKVVIAGPIDTVGEERYKNKIIKSASGFKKDIIFLGALKEEEMGSFYSLIDILVLPSVNSTEAFGMVQVEAMMSGIPVVASDLPGVRVPIRETGMGLLATPKNYQSLAEAVLKVTKNKQKYINKTTEMFQLDRVMDKWKNLLSAIN